MKLKGIPKGTAIRLMAEHGGQAVEFHNPDKDAEAIYDYYDNNLKLVKQVLRYPGKKFAQRRPYKGGLRWDVEGVEPTLYNGHLARYSRTVCICEGEKDCDNVNGLKLHDVDGSEIFAVTSGGADSWADDLAEQLDGKRVVLLPDADEAGARFAEAVQQSLRQRGIEFRVVRFDDAGAKDVTDYLTAGGTAEQVIQRLGEDWVRSLRPEHSAAPLVEP
jgi:5S rRNA maturation endonuclease (ribonuclease M5)